MGNIMKVMGNPNSIPFLPYEIIFNILKRLPVKVLIQFQCVCKDWKNLINSPSFIRDHLSHTSHRPTALLSHKPMLKSSFCFQLLDRRNMQVLEIQKPPLMDSFICLRIVGSCNGLVCLQVINEINWACYILLWNPATRQFRKIPRRSTIEDFTVDYIIRFGFTPIDNDYKIVIIRPNFAVNLVKVKVYSLNSGSWKEVEFENLEGTISIDSFGNVILNGVVYGLRSSVQHDYYDMVVSIDLTKHVCTSIPLPDLGSQKSRRVKLVFYENKPAVVVVTISSLVHLWVMEEDTCASRGRWIWTKKYTCSFCATSFCGMVRLSPFEFVPITIWKNEIVFRRRFSKLVGKRRFYLLSLTTSELKNFCIKCAPYDANSDFNYVESLVWVGNTNDKEL
ncbi:hypothetical protein K1719_011771 [Acacia pycnantha]|nr:hypothetical protein K1719_011771 [Acacia pycnantha]